MADENYRPLNQETDPEYNAKPGMVKVPGSKLGLEMERWEQFPSAWGNNPGNPYKFRPFPRMIFKAQKVNGKPHVMMPDPNRFEYKTRDEFKAAFDYKQRFDSECQRIVQSEAEFSRAMEDGWRASPDEAIQHVMGRDDMISRETAEREYRDQKMSEPARREIKAAKDAAGNEHLPEIPETPVRRRGRPMGSKNKPKTT